jgi:hypothetical protein
MLTRILTRLGSLALLAAAVSACGGDGAGPVAPPAAASAEPSAARGGAHDASLDVVEPPVLVTSMRRTKQLTRGATAFARIDARGGRITLKNAGLTLIVPPGAVARPTLFRATAIRGDMIAYDFAPHGTRFRVPLVVEQSVRQTDWAKDGTWKPCEAAYFKDVRQLDVRRRTALVDEFLPVTYDRRRGTMSFRVEHFSGYMISTGRSKTQDESPTP